MRLIADVLEICLNLWSCSLANKFLGLEEMLAKTYIDVVVLGWMQEKRKCLRSTSSNHHAWVPVWHVTCNRVPSLANCAEAKIINKRNQYVDNCV